MHHLQAQLNTLQRPKLLIRAARVAISEFQWGRDPKTDQRGGDVVARQKLFNTLLEEEHRLNEERVESEATYNVRRHIRTLTALMVVAADPVPRQRAA